MNEELKLCMTCGETKPLNRFGFQRYTRKSGDVSITYRKYCKDCIAMETRKSRYEKGLVKNPIFDLRRVSELKDHLVCKRCDVDVHIDLYYKKNRSTCKKCLNKSKSGSNRRYYTKKKTKKSVVKKIKKEKLLKEIVEFIRYVESKCHYLDLEDLGKLGYLYGELKPRKVIVDKTQIYNELVEEARIYLNNLED